MLTDAQIARLPKEWHGVHPVVPLDIASQITAAKPIGVEILDLCPVELRCQNPSRTPASLATVRVLPADLSVKRFYPKFSWVADRQGVSRLLLPANCKLGLAVRGRNGFLLAGLEIRRSAEDLQPASLSVTIPPTPIVRGRVLDAAGAGAANAPVLMNLNLRQPTDVEVAVRPLPAKGNAARLVPFEGFE